MQNQEIPATQPVDQERKKYICRGGASEAARKLRSKDQNERKEGAQYMAAYRKKKKGS